MKSHWQHHKIVRTKDYRDEVYEEAEWGEKAIPWHYNHYMNTDQDANWCVTRPWFDYIMGTRIKANPDLAECNPLGVKLPTFV